MTRTFASSPADVVTDALGNVLAGVKLTIKTDPGGVTITNLQTLSGTALPGYVTSNSQGRFPFQIPNDDYSRVQAVTPGGDIYRLPANEVFDQLGTAVSNAADAIAQASTANTNANQAKTQAATNATSITALTGRVSTAEGNIATLQAGTGTGGGGGGGSVTFPGPNRTWKNFTGGFCQHRTGGSSATVLGGATTAIHQPGTITAGEHALAMGCTFLDVDLQRDDGGTFWVMHDNDLSLTTDVGGLVLNSHTSVMAGAKVLASKTTGGRYEDQKLCTLREFLAHFAGRVPILAEPKQQAAGSEWALTVQLLQQQAAGYLDSIIFTISATNVDTNGSVIDNAGLPWGFYAQSANVNDTTIRSQAIAAHCKQIMITTNATQDTVDAYKTAGVGVIGFSTDRRSSVATFQTLGVMGIMAEHAAHVGQLGGQTVPFDSYRYGFWASGVRSDNQNRPKLTANGNGLLFDNPDGSGRQWYMLSEFAPLPAAFTLDIRLAVIGDPTANPNNWLGVNVCNQSDASFSDNGGVNPTGYTCLMFPGGASGVATALRIVTREASTQTTRAQSSIGAVVAADTDYWLRVVVTSSSITFSRRDNAGTQVGTAATYSDTQWRGGFLHLGGPIGAQQFYVKEIARS